jgi:hypothetical protein
MASAGLTWALNNGLTQAQYDKQIFDFFTNPANANLTDAQIESRMNQWGIGADDVSRVTGVSVSEINNRLDLAAPKTQAELDTEAEAQASLLERQQAETARLASLLETPTVTTPTVTTPTVTTPTAVTPPLVTTPVVTPPAVVTPPVVTTPVVKPPVVTPPVVKPPVTTPATNTALNAQLEAAYKAGDIALLNSLLAQNQVTSAQAKNMFNLTDADLSWIQNNAGGKFYTPPTATPGANMGIGGSFANFQSIPIGAQFNPAVTAGGASPYSQIMGQMKPFQNPYQNFVANTPMGGYDPGLYDRIEAANLAKAQAEAEIARLGGVNVYGGGGDGNSTAAGEGPGGNSGGGEGNGATAGEAGAGYAMGGMVNGLFGMNPPGPDDGAGYLDRGEYVVKKSAVNKYGKGLLDMINEGKVPAKKMKSLLG